MMVALLLYAYARGNRSSRGIERACVEDIAYRVVTGNLAPDHSTIAEFRCRHERPLGEVFSGVLGLCARAGLASVGVVAIDGTKMAASASSDANRDFGEIAREILAEAAAIDECEDELYGSARGDELPEQLLGDPHVVLADAGYWHQRQIETVASEGIQVLVSPDSSLRRGARPGWTGGLYDVMRHVLSTPDGRALYRRRQATIEPVFGQLKFNRQIRRFQRRGRAACRSEWRLIAATHNLLKLHRHRIAAVPG
jgi:hypothetical protein